MHIVYPRVTKIIVAALPSIFGFFSLAVLSAHSASQVTTTFTTDADFGYTQAAAPLSEGTYNMYRKSGRLFIPTATTFDFINNPNGTNQGDFVSDIFQVSKKGERPGPGRSCSTSPSFTSLEYWECNPSSVTHQSGSGLRFRFPGGDSYYGSFGPAGTVFRLIGTKVGQYSNPYITNPSMIWERNLLGLFASTASSYDSYAQSMYTSTPTYSVTKSFDIISEIALPSWASAAPLPPLEDSVQDNGFLSGERGNRDAAGQYFGVGTFSRIDADSAYGLSIGVQHERVNGVTKNMLELRALLMEPNPSNGRDYLYKQILPSALTGTFKLRIVRIAGTSGQTTLRGYYCPSGSTCSEALGNYTGWTPFAGDDTRTPAVESSTEINISSADQALFDPSLPAVPTLLMGFDKPYLSQTVQTQSAVYLTNNLDIYLRRLVLRGQDSNAAWNTRASWTKTIDNNGYQEWGSVSVISKKNVAADVIRATVSLLQANGSLVTGTSPCQVALTAAGTAETINLSSQCGWTQAQRQSSKLRFGFEIINSNQEAAPESLWLDDVTISSTDTRCTTDVECGVPAAVTFLPEGGYTATGQSCVSRQCVASSAVATDADGDNYPKSIVFAGQVYQNPFECDDTNRDINWGNNRCDVQGNGNFVKVMTTRALASGSGSDRVSFSALSPRGFLLNAVQRPGLCLVTPGGVALGSVTRADGRTFGDEKPAAVDPVGVRYYKGRSVDDLAYWPRPRVPASSGDNQAGIVSLASAPANDTDLQLRARLLGCPLTGWSDKTLCSQVPIDSPAELVLNGQSIVGDSMRVSRLNTCSLSGTLPQGCPQDQCSCVDRSTNKELCVVARGELSCEYSTLSNPIDLAIFRGPRVVRVSPDTEPVETGAPYATSASQKPLACLNSTAVTSVDQRLAPSVFSEISSVLSNANTDQKRSEALAQYPVRVFRCPTQARCTSAEGIPVLARSITYNPDLRTVVFEPAPDYLNRTPPTLEEQRNIVGWQPSATYLVEVRFNKIQSVSGAPLVNGSDQVGDVRWYFRTGETVCDISSVQLTPNAALFNKGGQIHSFTATAVSGQGQQLATEFLSDTPAVGVTGQGALYDVLNVNQDAKTFDVQTRNVPGYDVAYVGLRARGQTVASYASSNLTSIFCNNIVGWTENDHGITTYACRDGNPTLPSFTDVVQTTRQGRDLSDIKILSSHFLRLTDLSGVSTATVPGAKADLEISQGAGFAALPLTRNFVRTAGAEIVPQFLTVNGGYWGKRFTVTDAPLAPNQFTDVRLSSSQPYTFVLNHKDPMCIDFTCAQRFNHWDSYWSLNQYSRNYGWPSALKPIGYIIYRQDENNNSWRQHTTGIVNGLATGENVRTLVPVGYLSSGEYAISFSFVNNYAVFAEPFYAAFQSLVDILSNAGYSPSEWLGDTYGSATPQDPRDDFTDLVIDGSGLRINSMLPGQRVEVQSLEFVPSESGEDVVSIEVFSNPDSLSIAEWYRKYAPNPGSPSAVTVGGYPALQDGQGTYVAYFDANIAGTDLTYVPKVVVITGGTTPSGKSYREQFVKNFAMNAFEGTALRRLTGNGVENGSVNTIASQDWRIIQDLRSVTTRIKNGSVPQLSSGTYIPRFSVSTWPSWTDAFSSELGISAPKNPINAFVNGCSIDPDDESNFEASSCWNARQQQFQCIGNPSVYAYAFEPTRQGTSYQHAHLFTNLESQRLIVGNKLATVSLTPPPWGGPVKTRLVIRESGASLDGVVAGAKVALVGKQRTIILTVASKIDNGVSAEITFTSTGVYPDGNDLTFTDADLYLLMKPQFDTPPKAYFRDGERAHDLPKRLDQNGAPCVGNSWPSFYYTIQIPIEQ